MSYDRAQGRRGPVLKCDLCPAGTRKSFSDWESGTVTQLRKSAKENRGWRRDKLNRDICPEHSKLKGAR